MPTNVNLTFINQNTSLKRQPVCLCINITFVSIIIIIIIAVINK